MLSTSLIRVAVSVLKRGDYALGVKVLKMAAKFDTDSQLIEGIEEEEESGDFPLSDEEVEETEDAGEDPGEDTEGNFPLGALPHKERKRGPHPKDVGIAKEDWWNP